MPQKKPSNAIQRRALRRNQIIMGFIGVIIILSMVISLLRF